MFLQRARRNPLFLIVAGVILVATLVFAWWTISPLFIRTTLVEGQNITVPVADNGMNDAGTMDAPAMTDDSMGDSGMDGAEGAMGGDKVGMDEMEGAIGNDSMEPSKMEDDSMGGAGGEMMGEEAGGSQSMPPAEPMEPMGPMGPVVLATGNFDRKDDVHYANGQAILAREADGSTVVRLQDLNAANGPDLYVYVSEHANPQNSDELHMGGHNLGSLKATNGSFSYTLDAGIDPERIKSVVIYCRAFRVVFSTAALQGAQ